MGQRDKTEVSEAISQIFEVAFKSIMFILSLFSFNFSLLWSCFVFLNTSIQSSEKLLLLFEYLLRPMRIRQNPTIMSTDHTGALRFNGVEAA